ncbi:peptidase [Sphingobacterium sp. Ag1]|uniref:CPBP family intramembrane glutamic endopeptidase n=1 Tax=Sphingobacterium sp. Ag1 TaxID=1643451 RepID=UPI000627B60C|nr:type II CAAX endopeptidase family protein [Sphingobacterium sp. Ag1]KKO89305.1 peptidase [Sphingobacterium sp. Ag1]
MKRETIYLKVILFYVASLVLFAFAAAVTKQTALPDLLSLCLATFLSLALVYLFKAWDKISFSQIGLGFNKKSVLNFSAGLCLGFVMVGLMAIILTNFAEVSFKKQVFIDPKILTIHILLYFFVACREELVFRTYFLWRLKDKLGTVVAFSIMVLVFILEHLFTGFTLKAAVLGSGLGAVLFGLAVLRTRNIALSIGLHFGWNLTHWAFGFKNNTGLWVESVAKGSENQSENIAFIAYTIVMLLGILIVYRLSKKTSFQRNNRNQIH